MADSENVKDDKPKADAAAEPAQPMRDTHFDFEHKVFQITGAFFCPDPASKEPVFHITLGDLKAALGFSTLKESFDIKPEGRDAQLLESVAKGLKFVKVIHPGEEIPGELLDGRASWSVDDKHRMIARGRITVQLVSWITGHEMVVVDATELEQLVDDPATKERVKTACAEMAKRLNITEKPEETITGMIGSMVQELSYIEGLRDRFQHIKDISSNLQKVTALYRTDRAFTAEISRMQGLLKKPIAFYDGIFEQADAQTGEIVGALKSFDTTVHFIRKTRDDLRARLIDWEEILTDWSDTEVVKSTKLEQLCKKTYRFLATNFMESKVWERK